MFARTIILAKLSHESFLAVCNYWRQILEDVRPARLAYKPYFFSQLTVFFSHNKSANNTFSHGLSAKRTGQLVWQLVFAAAAAAMSFSLIQQLILAVCHNVR